MQQISGTLPGNDYQNFRLEKENQSTSHSVRHFVNVLYDVRERICSSKQPSHVTDKMSQVLISKLNLVIEEDTKATVNVLQQLFGDKNDEIETELVCTSSIRGLNTHKEKPDSDKNLIQASIRLYDEARGEKIAKYKNKSNKCSHKCPKRKSEKELKKYIIPHSICSYNARKKEKISIAENQSKNGLKGSQITKSNAQRNHIIGCHTIKIRLSRSQSISKDRQMIGKKRREEIERRRTRSQYENILISNNAPSVVNARCNTLYELSKKDQIIGRKRREHILKSRNKIRAALNPRPHSLKHPPTDFDKRKTITPTSSRFLHLYEYGRNNIRKKRHCKSEISNKKESEFKPIYSNNTVDIIPSRLLRLYEKGKESIRTRRQLEQV